MMESGYFPSPFMCCAICVLGMEMADGGRKMGSSVPNMHTLWLLDRADRHEEWLWNGRGRSEMKRRSGEQITEYIRTIIIKCLWSYYLNWNEERIA